MRGKGGGKGGIPRPFQIQSMARGSGAGPQSLRDPAKDDRMVMGPNGASHDDDGSQPNRPPTATPLPTAGGWGVKNLPFVRPTHPPTPPTASPAVESPPVSAQQAPPQEAAPTTSQQPPSQPVDSHPAPGASVPPSAPSAPGPSEAPPVTAAPSNLNHNTGPAPAAPGAPGAPADVSNGIAEEAPTKSGMDWADDEMMDWKAPPPGIPPLVDKPPTGGRVWSGGVPTATQPPQPRPAMATEHNKKKLQERYHRRNEEDRAEVVERQRRCREKLRQLQVEESPELRDLRREYEEELQKQTEVDKRRKEQEAHRKDWLKLQAKQRKTAIEEIKRRAAKQDPTHEPKRPVQRVTAPASTTKPADDSENRNSGKGREQRDSDWSDRENRGKGYKAEGGKGGKSQGRGVGKSDKSVRLPQRRDSEKR